MNLRSLLALSALTLLLTACPRPPTPVAPADAALRALHGVADAPNVDVLIDGEAVLEDVAYKAGSGYLNLSEGERQLTVTAASDPEAVVLEAALELVGERAYTVIVLGEAAEETDFPIEALVLDDTTTAPEEGNIKVRVVHGVPGAPNVDVYVTTPAGQLADPTLEDVAYKGFNEEFLEITGGDYRVRLTAAGETDVIYDSATITLAAGGIYTIVALSETDPEAQSPITLVVLQTGELPPVNELPDQTPPPDPSFGLELVATVGTEAGVCATESEITVLEGTEIFYCYTITNTSEVTIPIHDLADEVFGVILRDFEFELEPGASIDTVTADLTLNTTLAETTVNNAVWDGFVEDRRVATAEAATTVNVTPLNYELALTATVGTEPDECASESDLELVANGPQTVYYCYTITNTGNATIPLHNLEDEVVGIILRDFEFELEPGASVNTVGAGLMLDATLDADTANTAVWEGFVGDRRVATAEAATTVTFVPPFEFAAAAGTVVGDSNNPTISAFDGNLLLVGIRNFDASPIEQEVVVTITVPSLGSFDYLFDPTQATEGIVALLIRDFEADFSSMSASDDALAQALRQVLTIPVEVVTIERPAFSPQAAVGGEFVFAFPGQTITRTVDADAKLTVPEVTDVTLNDERDELTVDFASAGSDVSYQLVAFGRGNNAYVGTTSSDSASATVTLSGALEEDEPYVVEVTATQPASFDPATLFDIDNPLQPNLAQYLHYSE
jgi:hypothetical protein